MLHFAHIAPTSLLDFACADQEVHLVLAHLVLEDPLYCQWYLRQSELGKTLIIDNSGFELFKRGEPPMGDDDLMKAANKVKATYVVMTDYPGKPSYMTIEAAEQQASVIKSHGFKTFFVPQGMPGDVKDLLKGFEWASCNGGVVDYVGLSILAIPLAYGCEHIPFKRYLARHHFIETYKDSIGLRAGRSVKYHLLGMTDGPNEIRLLSNYLPKFSSWDSSSAVWAGLNGIRFDDSPTGLAKGKVESAVDFSLDKATIDEITNINYNIKYINKLLE